MKPVLVWVAMHTVNPEWQEPTAVYANKQDALGDGWEEEDLVEVLFYA